MANEPLQLVNDVRRRLVQLSYARALAFGVAAAVLVFLVVSLVLPMVWPASEGAMPLLAYVAGVVAAGVAISVSRARDGDITCARAALWLEERFPALQYALVTLTELDSGVSRDVRGSQNPQSSKNSQKSQSSQNPQISQSPQSSYSSHNSPSSPSSQSAQSSQDSMMPGNDTRARLVAAVGNPNVQEPLKRSALNQLRMPFILAVVLLAIAGPVHARAHRAVYGNDGLRTAGSSGSAASKPANTKALAGWRIRVVPPVYSALETRTLDDASQISALVGSRVDVVGIDAELPTATMKSVADSVAPVTLSVARAGAGWRTQLTMPRSPADVRFALGVSNRQLLLEPRADSVPIVRLQLPARDSVYREPKGVVSLDATAHDDLGLATVSFELIVTSGEGERFTARSVVLGALRLNNERERRWQASLTLDTMKLVAGDIVHMRAVARDRHPDAAREHGASETRTFRVARSNEYDSVAVEPAPPPEVQKSLMSQRMLLILTEKLAARRTTLSRDVLVAESRKLASDQVRLRKTIGNLVFQRLEGEDTGEHAHSADDGHDHGVKIEQGKLVQTGTASNAAAGPPMTDGEGDESPIININKPLLEAYNAMWDAASALEVAEPKSAIPHMKLALAAIERARSAERIYLRGKPPVVIVDIAKVRLVGKDTGQVNTRAAREALSPREAARETRLLAAALLLTRDVNAGRDSLALLRLESLNDAPRLAAALNDALEIVRRGGNVTDALIRARRALGGSAKADSLGNWRGL